MRPKVVWLKKACCGPSSGKWQRSVDLSLNFSDQPSNSSSPLHVISRLIRIRRTHPGCFWLQELKIVTNSPFSLCLVIHDFPEPWLMTLSLVFGALLYMYTYTYIHMYIYIYVCIYIYTYVCSVSIYLRVCLSIYLSIYLAIYLSFNI